MQLSDGNKWRKLFDKCEVQKIDILNSKENAGTLMCI